MYLNERFQELHNRYLAEQMVEHPERDDCYIARLLVKQVLYRILAIKELCCYIFTYCISETSKLSKEFSLLLMYVQCYKQ